MLVRVGDIDELGEGFMVRVKMLDLPLGTDETGWYIRKSNDVG